MVGFDESLSILENSTRRDILRCLVKEPHYPLQLSEILDNDEELEVGEFELGVFTIKVNKIKTYEEELIKCER